MFGICSNHLSFRRNLSQRVNVTAEFSWEHVLEGTKKKHRKKWQCSLKKVSFFGKRTESYGVFLGVSGVQGISPVVWLRGFTFTSTLAPEGLDDGPDTRDIFPFVRNGAQWFSQLSPPPQKKSVFLLFFL